MFKQRLVFSHAVMIAFVGLLMFLIGLPAANASQEVGIKIKGNVIETEPAPFIENNRVMVPVRELVSALGADVSWNEGQRSVTIKQGELHITMSIGESHAVVNGNDVQMEALPVIVNGRTMVPVRFLAEGLQVPVSWDSETRVVSVGEPALVAGSSLDFPPFEYIENDEIVGFDIDLIKALEEVSGEKITVKNTSFDALIPSLRSGQIDMIISGMEIVEQRKEVMSFTDPYSEWGEIILSTKGSKSDIALEDLAGKKIAVQAGSNANDIVGTLSKNHPRMQVTPYDTMEQVWAAVEKGQADAAVVAYPPTANYLTNHPESNLQMIGKLIDARPMGIGVQKDDQELLVKLNKSLEIIRKNGTYDRIYEKWFGPSR
ncbi:MAG: extracellular solute-binding protein family 3 [Firmicutes bacterium]|nr:extracellular solute-binding protein family 3 [Bacillota bacterium]